VTTYQVAEKFKSVQGEGVYAGTPMAFIRFVGCSVGKRICQHCDTDFDKTMLWRGGGEFHEKQLLTWAAPYRHVCLTGGEPLDQELRPLLRLFYNHNITVHIETSGTKSIEGALGLELDVTEPLWICVSPKPGWLEESIDLANEVKVIVPGLGEYKPRMISFNTGGMDVSQKIGDTLVRGEGTIPDPSDKNRWPTLDDALRWASAGKTVFLQPRNARLDVDRQNLLYVQDIIRDHPQLRLSVQLHKLLKVQ